MKKIVGLAISISMAFSSFAFSQSKEESVSKMLEVMKIDQQMMGGFEAMLPTINQLAAQLKLNSTETEELKNIYREWFQNDFDRFYIGTQIADLYADTFTQEEIEAITRFYLTPAGKKMIDKTPELTKIAARFGMEEAQRKQHKLVEKLEPFIEKHQP